MKAFSIGLLVCFSLVLLPKHWWHDCAHTAHPTKTEHTHEQTLDEDCPVCDLSLSVFTSPKPLFLQINQQAPFVHKSLAQLVVFQSYISHFSLRAPPSKSV
ncbi:MAG: hypothetical protein ACKOWW_08255 [Flavobacteriales bacterium]